MTVNVPDGATRMHNAIIHFFVQLVTRWLSWSAPGAPVDRRGEPAG